MCTSHYEALERGIITFISDSGVSFPLRPWLPMCVFGEGRQEGKGKEKELDSRGMALTTAI